MEREWSTHMTRIELYDVAADEWREVNPEQLRVVDMSKTVEGVAILGVVTDGADQRDLAYLQRVVTNTNLRAEAGYQPVVYRAGKKSRAEFQAITGRCVAFVRNARIEDEQVVVDIAFTDEFEPIADRLKDRMDGFHILVTVESGPHGPGSGGEALYQIMLQEL